MAKPAVFVTSVVVGLMPAAVGAEELTCQAKNAWRLEDGGLVAHPEDFYGLAEVCQLSVDLVSGAVSSKSGPIAGLIMTSRFDPAAGADVVLAAPDGKMVFRARDVEGAISFLLLDTYDLYVGNCRR